ncbi:MAG TPA: hypothetical protein VFA60_00395 [Terriglobales bacterium]|nr:hypothetical protein [Terriglobales bacterium]
MKAVVARERNKGYYRVLHVPIWVWVFFILPGHLTSDLYQHGPDRRHWIWLAMVVAVCAWRGALGRLPGVEPRPYITHYGMDKPNLGYRVVCYTAAWIDLLVPYTLNLIGLATANLTGRWMLPELYTWLYYPMAIAVVLATLLNWTPRARRTTRNEGAEKAWFYVAIWTVVPCQIASWAMWRLGSRMGLDATALARARLGVFVLVSLSLFLVTFLGKLPRTARYYLPEES